MACRVQQRMSHTRPQRSSGADWTPDARWRSGLAGTRWRPHSYPDHHTGRITLSRCSPLTPKRNCRTKSFFFSVCYIQYISYSILFKVSLKVTKKACGYNRVHELCRKYIQNRLLCVLDGLNSDVMSVSLFVCVILVLCSSLNITHVEGNVSTRQLNTLRAFQIKGSLASTFACHIWRFTACPVNEEIFLLFVNCVGYWQRHTQSSIIFAGVPTKAGHKRILCMETWNSPHSWVRRTASPRREHLEGRSATVADEFREAQEVAASSSGFHLLLQRAEKAAQLQTVGGMVSSVCRNFAQATLFLNYLLLSIHRSLL